MHVDIQCYEGVLTVAGWAKFMEWTYPVEIVITNKAAFKGAGAIEAAATL